MYRMLIVDDEAIIADGLYEVFQSVKTLDLDIYKAYSAFEALELLNKTRIDLVLSDIHMPGMDGLQLLEQIHNRWPKCRVIFLTGYNEFDYVYTAIQYEGVSYLLKTEGYDKVIQTVQSTVAEIERNFKQETLLQEAEKQLETARELLRGNFLTDVLKGRLFEQEINAQQFSELGIHMDAGEQVVMLIGRIDSLPKGLPYSEKTRRLYSVSITAEKYFGDCIQYVQFNDESSYLVWLIQPGRDMMSDTKTMWEKCITFVKGNLELVQLACLESAKVSVSFALDDTPSRWVKLQNRLPH